MMQTTELNAQKGGSSTASSGYILIIVHMQISDLAVTSDHQYNWLSIKM